MPSQLAAQRRLLVAQFPVPMIPAPLANSPQRLAESVVGGLAFGNPSSLPAASPVVSEPTTLVRADHIRRPRHGLYIIGISNYLYVKVRFL